MRAGDDLTLETDVNVMSVALTGATSDLVLRQRGDLLIRSLALGGGDVTIEVEGGRLTIQELTGRVGTLTLRVLGGPLVLGDLALADLGLSGTAEIQRVVIEVSAGGATIAIDADELNLVARNDIVVRERDSLRVESLDTTAGGRVDFRAGGAADTTTVLGSVRTTDGHAVSIVTDTGALRLERAITALAGSAARGGDITIRGAAGLELGAEADLTSEGGDITLSAGTGSLLMTAETYVRAGTGLLDVSAEGNIRLGKFRSEAVAAPGEALLPVARFEAGGVIDGGEGDIDIVAPGSLLVIRSTAGIGQAANPVEVQVRAIDLHNSGSGAIAIEEADGLQIVRVLQTAGGPVAIATRAGDITLVSTETARAITGDATATAGITVTAGGADVSLYAGRGALTLAADIRTTGGDVRLTAEGVAGSGGNLVLGAGIQASGAAPGSVGGVIALRAVQGSILVDEGATRWLRDGAGFDRDVERLLTLGLFSVDTASGRVVAAGVPDDIAEATGIRNGDDLRSAGGAYLQSRGGAISLTALGEVGRATAGFSYSPQAVFIDAASVVATSAARENVSVVAAGAVTVGAATGSGSRAGSTDVVSLSGLQSLSRALDANGADVAIAADDVDISATVRSVGGTLSFRTIDPSRGILLGELAAAGGMAARFATSLMAEDLMTLDTADLRQLRDGFNQIVFGAPGGSNRIMVMGDGGVRLRDDVVFHTDGAGGAVLFESRFDAPSLTIFGSGETTRVAADIAASAGDLTVNDAIRVAGERELRASGSVLLGGSNVHWLGGDAPGDNRLSVVAAAGSVRFTGAVGGGDNDSVALSGLSVRAALDVVFEQSVTVDGDLVIDAGGVVVFNGSILLRGGGDLLIRGAQQVVLRSGIVLDGAGGDILIEADEIDLLMGEEQIVGSGWVTLRPSTLSQAIAVASPAGVGTGGVLNLDMAELRALADGFAGIAIGHAGSDGRALAGSGLLTVGARTDLDSVTFRDSTWLYGSTVVVADSGAPDAVLRLAAGAALQIEAVGLIQIANAIEAESVGLRASQGNVQQVDSAIDGRIGDSAASS